MFVGILEEGDNIMRSSQHGSIYGDMGGGISLSSHSFDKKNPTSVTKTFRRRPTALIEFSPEQAATAEISGMLDGASGSDDGPSARNSCAEGMNDSSTAGSRLEL